MMTTNLFVIANVKQLRTGGSFRILVPFFRTSWGVGVLNSAIFNSFHNRVEFGTIWRAFWISGGGGGWTNLPPPPSTPLAQTGALLPRIWRQQVCVKWCTRQHHDFLEHETSGNPWTLPSKQCKNIAWWRLRRTQETLLTTQSSAVILLTIDGRQTMFEKHFRLPLHIIMHLTALHEGHADSLLPKKKKQPSSQVIIQ